MSFTPMTEDTAEVIAKLCEQLWEAHGGKEAFAALPIDHEAKIIMAQAFEALQARFDPATGRPARPPFQR